MSAPTYAELVKEFLVAWRSVVDGHDGGPMPGPGPRRDGRIAAKRAIAIAEAEAWASADAEIKRREAVKLACEAKEARS